jgi:hypothetical protein
MTDQATTARLVESEKNAAQRVVAFRTGWNSGDAAITSVAVG